MTRHNQGILSDLQALQAKCDSFRTATDPIVTAQIDVAQCVKAAPAEIMNLNVTAAAVDDITAYALLTSRPRKSCRDSTTDFEANGMLRGKRPPRSKGVAIEAFGIR
jgi:hypothetical protein